MLARLGSRRGGLFAFLRGPRLGYAPSMGWTLQSLIDGKMTIEAYCQTAPCHHHQTIDIEKLRDRFGPDAPAMADDLAPKMRCAKCGGKKVGLIYSPAGNEKMAPRGPRC